MIKDELQLSELTKAIQLMNNKLGKFEVASQTLKKKNVDIFSMMKAQKKELYDHRRYSRQDLIFLNEIKVDGEF